jgi:hypothetical protein
VSEAKAYAEIAERALLASDGALEKGIHEKAAFLGYHAFESLGGAFCANNGAAYPRGHGGKINMFVSEARRERFARHVALLAIEYGSLRNAVLYPAVTTTGAIQEPKTVLSDPQARRLLGRTRALAKKIKPLL